ncbi:MAG: NADH-quinone oxidoreductase subunit NuoG, partial [Gammaproteobacteria bacterium]
MPKIEIDGKICEVPEGSMIIEAADAIDSFIPRFCYHKKLSIAANCRMCLVEVEKAPKPVPACATPVTDGMKIWTKSKKALEAQRSVMEFLLINHPLDCPICDQGGQCELQDFSMGYGQEVSNYAEPKRAVQDQNIGPLIATEMTRCIHCTRCVRFGTEVAGQRELGATGRGEHMEIGTFVEKSLSSELSGNVIDLCPVGSLTSKPFQFKARAWEMQSHDAIAPHDGLGSHISIHTRGNEVLRVVPKEEEAINEVWLSDRDRFSYQAIHSTKRLHQALEIRGGEWVNTGLEAVLNSTVKLIEKQIKQDKRAIAGLIHPSSTTEELYLFQKLCRGLGIENIDHRLWLQDEYLQHPSNASHPIEAWPSLGGSIAGLEQEPHVIIIGSELRHELPLLSVRLRKQVANGGKISVINPIDYEFNFEIENKIIINAGDYIAAIKKLAPQIKTGGRILVGDLLLSHPMAADIMRHIEEWAEATKMSLGYLHRGANARGAYHMACVPQSTAAKTAEESEIKLWLLFGVDPELDVNLLSKMNPKAKIIAFSSFDLPVLRKIAQIILPMNSFAETEGSYINLEGKLQAFKAAVHSGSQSESRPAWKVLRVLGNLLKIDGFEYQTWEEVHEEVKTKLQNTPVFKSSLIHLKDLKPRKWDTEKSKHLIVLQGYGLYQADTLLRHAQALNQTPLADRVWVGINSATLKKQAEFLDQLLEKRLGEKLPYRIEDRVPKGVLWIPKGHRAGSLLNPY